jgi:hypothetical protein
VTPFQNTRSTRKHNTDIHNDVGTIPVCHHEKDELDAAGAAELESDVLMNNQTERGMVTVYTTIQPWTRHWFESMRLKAA